MRPEELAAAGWPAERLRALDKHVAECAGWEPTGAPMGLGMAWKTPERHVVALPRFTEGEGLIPLLEAEGIGVGRALEADFKARLLWLAWKHVPGRAVDPYSEATSEGPNFAIAGGLAYCAAKGHPFEG